MRRAPLCAAALLLALACQTPDVSSGDRQAYNAALKTLARDTKAGTQALSAFVDEHPKSALADDAAYRLAELATERGDDEEAMRRLAWIVRTQPKGDRSDVARLTLARLLRAHGRTSAAYHTAEDVRLSLLDRPQRAEAEEMLADLAREVGDRPAALRYLARARGDQESAAEVDRLDGELQTALEALSEGELESAANALGRAVPAARVRLRQAELALARGDTDDARVLLERASQLPMAPPDADRATAFEQRLAGGAGIPTAGGEGTSTFPDAAHVRGTLGVVLPLTGELAGAGEETLDGVLLASGVLSGGETPSVEGAPPGQPASAGLHLRVRDTGGAPERAAAAFQELAADPAVLAVVGPLTAEEALAVAPESDRLGLPLITLTRHEEVAVGHPNVFRIGLTPGAEAERLAEYAVSTLGVHSVGILHPNDAYGERMQSLFRAALERRGGSVTGVASYDADATDFSAAIQQLIRSAGGKPVDTAPNAAPPSGVPGGFDAIFVPDAHPAVGLIAPALAYAGIRGVRLLGTNAWNDPGLVAVGREHVEGAVFTGAVVRESTTPILAEFATRFRAGFARPPGALAALGFDATLLALRGLVAGSTTRESLRGGLVAAPPFQGVSGETDFATDGNAQRRPYLLGVEGGRIVDLDDLGRPPTLPAAPVPPPT